MGEVQSRQDVSKSCLCERIRSITTARRLWFSCERITMAFPSLCGKRPMDVVFDAFRVGRRAREREKGVVSESLTSGRNPQSLKPSNSLEEPCADISNNDPWTMAPDHTGMTPPPARNMDHCPVQEPVLLSRFSLVASSSHVGARLRDNWTLDKTEYPYYNSIVLGTDGAMDPTRGG